MEGIPDCKKLQGMSAIGIFNIRLQNQSCKRQGKKSKLTTLIVKILRAI